MLPLHVYAQSHISLGVMNYLWSIANTCWFHTVDSYDHRKAVDYLTRKMLGYRFSYFIQVYHGHEFS